MFNLALSISFVLCTFFSVFSNFEALVINVTALATRPPGMLTVLTSASLFCFITLAIYFVLRILPGAGNLQMRKLESAGLTVGNGLLTAIGAYWLLAIYANVGAAGSSAEIVAMISMPGFITLCSTALLALWIFGRAILSKFGVLYDDNAPYITIDPISLGEVFGGVILGLIPVLYVFYIGQLVHQLVPIGAH